MCALGWASTTPSSAAASWCRWWTSASTWPGSPRPLKPSSQARGGGQHAARHCPAYSHPPARTLPTGVVSLRFLGFLPQSLTCPPSRISSRGLQSTTSASAPTYPSQTSDSRHAPAGSRHPCAARLPNLLAEARLPLHPPCHAVQPCELEGLMSRLDQEFQFYGVTLKDLIGRGERAEGDSHRATVVDAVMRPNEAGTRMRSLVMRALQWNHHPHAAQARRCTGWSLAWGAAPPPPATARPPPPRRPPTRPSSVGNRQLRRPGQGGGLELLLPPPPGPLMTPAVPCTSRTLLVACRDQRAVPPLHGPLRPV
jgi:hypothetical protein